MASRDFSRTSQVVRRPTGSTWRLTRQRSCALARCLQVEVASQGETIEESLENLREALELYFEDAPAPEVTDVITAPVEVRRAA